MKFSVVGIAVSAAVLLGQGCSPAKNQTLQSRHEHHSMTQDSKGTKSATSNHEKHEQQSSTEAKLIAPPEIKSTQSVPLAINIQDKAGKAVNSFDTFQDKQMHLIVVSDDLRFFQHVHPTFKGNGRFEVNPDFPAPGSYTLFSDYKPAGEKEQISIQKLTIPGNVPLPTELEKFSNTKILAGTKVNLKLPQTNIKAGKEVKLSFDLQEAIKNQPVKDLQPYLGEKGHLVIVRSSSPLAVSDYIHAHALKDSSPGEVNFMSSFPQKGTYKLWLQFNRNGKVNTADFWVNVI
jgi:hypothetical protein